MAGGKIRLDETREMPWPREAPTARSRGELDSK